jgi:hypothetical protein
MPSSPTQVSSFATGTGRLSLFCPVRFFPHLHLFQISLAFVSRGDGIQQTRDAAIARRRRWNLLHSSSARPVSEGKPVPYSCTVYAS